MPEKKTRLAQMIVDEQKRREWTDNQCAEFVDELQQTFANWKRTSVPRLPRPKLAEFLHISEDMLSELAEEARESQGSTKLPSLSVYTRAPVRGQVSDRKAGKFKFEPILTGFGQHSAPQGRYAVIVDTKVMEPAFKVGCKVWLDPSVWPRVGDDVIAHTRGGLAWIGKLDELGDTVRLSRYAGEPAVVGNVAAVHVIVLAERV